MHPDTASVATAGGLLLAAAGCWCRRPFSQHATGGGLTGAGQRAPARRTAERARQQRATQEQEQAGVVVGSALRGGDLALTPASYRPFVISLPAHLSGAGKV